jgi:hypothetical protein
MRPKITVSIRRSMIASIPKVATLFGRGRGEYLGHQLSERLPHVLVTVNLGMAGIAVVAISLVGPASDVCPVFPLNAWTLVSCWCKLHREPR